jgi:hemolysin III
VLKCFFVERLPILSTSTYVAMGWIALIAVRPLMAVLPVSALLWLLAGGLCYTGGVAFFAWNRKYAHTVWHIFVLAGSACHFVAVMRYVLRAGA